MNINGGPSLAGLQHMAAKSLEARKAAGLLSSPGNAESVPATDAAGTAETAATGNNLPETGENLPPETPVVESTEKPEHLTGLERAIEQLELNAAKNPDARGLKNALEKLVQRSQERHAIDTQA